MCKPWDAGSIKAVVSTRLSSEGVVEIYATRVDVVDGSLVMYSTDDGESEIIHAAFAPGDWSGFYLVTPSGAPFGVERRYSYRERQPAGVT